MPCKSGKPAGTQVELWPPDQVVRDLQDGTVRGREAREAGVMASLSLLQIAIVHSFCG